MREIDKVLDQSEKVFWEGKPKFWPFFFGRSVPIAIFGFFWLAFMIGFFALSGFSPWVLLLPHFWISIFMVFGPPIYNALVYKNIYFAITNKRVILQRGVIGRDFEIVDFDQITNAEVNVGFFDKVLGRGSGSILIASAGTITYGRQGAVVTPYKINNIDSPYEVFRFFKKVSHAVKTDIEYPNKYRPTTNPGYGTDYDPRSPG